MVSAPNFMPFFSLRHGGAQTRLVVQTRREPKNVDPVEQSAMQVSGLNSKISVKTYPKGLYRFGQDRRHYSIGLC